MNTFEYLVTLNPDNNEKFEEMYNDTESRKIILDIYQAQIQSEKFRTNQIVASLFDSYKEGRLAEHYAYLIAQVRADVKSE